MSSIVAQTYHIPHPYRDPETLARLRVDCGKTSLFDTRLKTGQGWEMHVRDVLLAVGLDAWCPVQNLKSEFAKYQIDLQVRLPNGVIDIEVKARRHYRDGSILQYLLMDLGQTHQFDLKEVQPEHTFIVDQMSGDIYVTWVPYQFWRKRKSDKGESYAIQHWMFNTLDHWLEDIAFQFPQLIPDHPESSKGLEFQRYQWQTMKEQWEEQQRALAA
jgi:hypothetical protein